MTTYVTGRKYAIFLLTIGLLTATALMSFRRQGAGGKMQGANMKQAGNPSFLFLSDVHVASVQKTTTYGQDAGDDLFAAFLNKVDGVMRSKQRPTFIVYTGDLPAHYSCWNGCHLAPADRGTHNNNIDTMLTALHRMADKYSTPVFYLPGNNDGLAGDYYSFADEQQQTPLSLVPASPYFFPKSTGNAGGAMTIPCMVSNLHPNMGYYSAYPVKGLRLVMLNTVIYSRAFTAVDGTTQQRDGNVQMIWLAGQLADAAAKKEQVLIAMHVPPGKDAYSSGNMWTQLPGNTTNWLNQFLDLTAQYKSTIAGILYGHTHMDEVRRMYDSTGSNITAVAISCPGVTPQHKNNPGFKTVQYDATTMALLDFTTYYTHPGEQTWGDSTYTFGNTYGRLPGTTIYSRLSGMQLPAVTASMNRIYTVKNGPVVTYSIAEGIEVKRLPVQ